MYLIENSGDVSLYHNGSKVIAKNGDLEFNLGSILWNQTGDAY